MAKRYSGQSLANIAAAENCTIQNISQLIQRALGHMPQQSVAEIRLLECGRLDELLAAVWPAAKIGDIAAIDRVLAIMKRRAAMLGLDLQPGYFSRDDSDTDQVVRVEIVGSPEKERVRWLEERSERLRELEAGDAPTTGTLQ